MRHIPWMLEMRTVLSPWNACAVLTETTRLTVKRQPCISIKSGKHIETTDTTQRLHCVSCTSESTPRVYWTHPEAWREQRRWDECWKLRRRSSGVTWGEHDVPYTWNPRSTAAMSRLRKPVRREQSFLWTSCCFCSNSSAMMSEPLSLDSMKSRHSNSDSGWEMLLSSHHRNLTNSKTRSPYLFEYRFLTFQKLQLTQ